MPRPNLLRRRAIVAAVLAALVIVVTACTQTGRSSVSTDVAPTVRPIVSPTPNLHGQAIAAFVESVAGGTLTYRVDYKGMARLSAHTLPIAGTMDVAGTDFAASFTYDWRGEGPGLGKVRVQVRAVKGKGYIKRAGAAWTTVKGYGEAHSYVPFRRVRTTADVRYLGPVEVGKRIWHKIGIEGAVLIHPNTVPYMVKREAVDGTRLEIVLDDAGRPRSGTWTLLGRARVGPDEGQLQRVEYELSLTFSKVGADLRIKRP
jgi:hypothetical protein